MAMNRVPFTYNSDSDSDSEDFYSSALFNTGQRRHDSPMAAGTIDYDLDLDYAFNLQLQEALAASLSLQASSSTASDGGSVENSVRPFGEGSSRRTAGESSSAAASASTSHDQEALFSLYFKGWVAEEKVGIGVAICDSQNNLIFEISKAVPGGGMNRTAAEAMALIEGLNAALSLGLKRIVFHCDNIAIHKFILGRWKVRQQKVSQLICRVLSLQKKFVQCISNLAARNEIKFAIKLARDALQPQPKKSSESSRSTNNPTATETCVICLEDSDANRIFSVTDCKHRYCFSCMRQHVEYKLRNALAPVCPHENCKSKLDLASCEKFLTPKCMEIMRQREKEAKTPVAERVYCPNPKCSVLMSKSEVSENARKEGIDQFGARRCVKCKDLFCIKCKVPWHRNMDCAEYKRRNPNPPINDTKLKALASMNLWSQCKKCNLVIELAEGCYHMTCRCGNEFCYNCGAEWKDKKATCQCPLWTENNILQDDDSDFEDEYEEEESEEEDGIYFIEDFGFHYSL